MSFALDAYDLEDGSIVLAWGAYPSASSYNVYVNGALNQHVEGLTATVSSLTETTYSSSAVAAPSGNSLRPQNMPPNGEVSPSGTYVFAVAAVVAALEVAIVSKTFTVSPTSIMLATPMKRLWPFPNTGLD